jgi:hypothetical protein
VQQSPVFVGWVEWVTCKRWCSVESIKDSSIRNMVPTFERPKTVWRRLPDMGYNRKPHMSSTWRTARANVWNRVHITSADSERKTDAENLTNVMTH